MPGRAAIARKVRRIRPVTRRMGAQSHEALEAATAALDGPVIRTSASVIGKRGGESIIVATTGGGYTVTVLLSSPRLVFTVRARGWLMKSLALEGEHSELAGAVLAGARDAPAHPR